MGKRGAVDVEIVDFQQLQKAKVEQQRKQKLQQQLQQFKAGNTSHIRALLQAYRLETAHRSKFMAFVGQLEQSQITPFQLFYNVFHLEKRQFEVKYKMKWDVVVINGLTFMAILKEGNPQELELFLSLFQ